MKVDTDIYDMTGVIKSSEKTNTDTHAGA